MSGRMISFLVHEDDSAWVDELVMAIVKKRLSVSCVPSDATGFFHDPVFIPADTLDGRDEVERYLRDTLGVDC